MSKKKPAKKAVAERPVIITTEHKGVFFGYARNTSGSTVKLARARNVIYWSSDCKGFLGLAATGPTRSCKIGPAAASLELRNITAVVDVSEAAVKAWEAAPWSN